MRDLGIAGKSAIVCGSSRGLGRASAEALARAGVTVLCSVPAAYITGQNILVDGGVFNAAF